MKPKRHFPCPLPHSFQVTRLGTRILSVSLSVLTVGLFCQTGTTQAAEDPTPKAVIAETNFRFGQVTQGTKVQHDFEIGNSGDAPLKINNIYAACGCTAAVLDSDTISPGAKTLLRVSFDTTGFQGLKSKSIRLYTNDPKLPSALLSVEGSISPDIEVNPPRVLFGDVRWGESARREVILSIPDQANIALQEVNSRNPHIQVEEPPSSDSGRARRKLVISLKPTAPIGTLRDKISVKTTSKNNPVLNIPIFAKVKGDVDLRPEVVSFGLLDGPLENPASQFLKIKSRSPHLVRVTRVSSDVSGITAEVVGTTDEGETTIKVTIRTEIVGVFRASLSVETDSQIEGEKTISVPVYGIISKKSE